MGLFSALRSSSPTVKKTPKAVESRIKNILGIQQLSAMPAQAAQAFQVASDPKAQAADFVEVIEADEALGARIIRIANSVYFFRGTPANDIEKAVANIGLDELRGILAATMLKNLLKGKGNSRKQIWSNAVATAVVSKNLSKRFSGFNTGETFLCGLVHDVGKLLMLQRNPELYEKVLANVAEGDKDFCTVEEELFELDHVEVGKWVAERWNFPENAIEAISSHHKPWPSSPGELKKNSDRGLLIKIADTLCHSAGIGHPPGFSGFRQRAEQEMEHCAKELNTSTDELLNFIQKNKQEFERIYSLYEEQS